jgi:hypothetical protein
MTGVSRDRATDARLPDPPALAQAGFRLVECAALALPKAPHRERLSVLVPGALSIHDRPGTPSSCPAHMSVAGAETW